MALKIRLARAGAKKRPFYRIVVADAAARATAASSRSSAATTRCCGRGHADRVALKEERIRHWLGVRARSRPIACQASSATAGIVGAGAPLRAPIKSAPRSKAQERAAAERRRGGGACGRARWRRTPEACRRRSASRGRRPHGVRGAVKLRCYTAEPEAVAAYGPLDDAEGRAAVRR